MYCSVWGGGGSDFLVVFHKTNSEDEQIRKCEIRQGNYGVALHLTLYLVRGSIHLLICFKGHNVSSAGSVSISRGKLWKLPTELGSIYRAGIREDTGVQ